MPLKKYIVRLSADEQIALKRLVKTGKAAAYKRQRAQILLQADENRSGGGLQDKKIADNLGVGTATVERIRRRLVEKGFDKVLEREAQSGSRRRRLDGEQEAQLIALS
ncbi:MAG: helix-turn-helix domain-containing protein, partial [Cellvibrionaceae bacterium]|nr:helix-turn-helix domain-containing protein [Cellvibrionaceae bacterium]